jgi:hypothetical protein
VDPSSTLSVLIGALIIATRGPLIFVPAATLRFYDKLIATHGRIRALAVVIAPLALALIALPLGEGRMAEMLRIVGWLFAAAVLWLVAAPGSYRTVARGFLEVFESADEAIVRILGVLAVMIGLAFINAGIS